MIAARSVLMALGLCLLVAHGTFGEEDAFWDELLSIADLDRKSAQLPSTIWRGGGELALPVFDRLWADWFEIRPAATRATDRLLARPGELAPKVAFAAELLSSRSEQADEPARATAGLVEFIAQIHERRGDPLSPEGRGKLEEMSKRIPGPVAAAAGRLLAASLDACADRDAAFAALADGPKGLEELQRRIIQFARDGVLDPATQDLLRRTDLARLAAGGERLADAVDQAVAELKGLQTDAFGLVWDTPMGRIALSGVDNDVYESQDYLLIIDSGGDDRYAAGGGTRNVSSPVSILVDLAGNDRYESKEPIAFGAGVLGYGFLYDGGGNDAYACEAISQGAGVAGIGVLVDAGGNDAFEAVVLSQGAAVLGIGVLETLDGNDAYHCWQKSQGFAGARGCGVLVDGAGNDTYDADDKDIKFPSPQTAAHNTSLAQGCGFGRRGHYQGGDGRSVAGGVGILIDGAGNDTDTGGVFAQGTSYWYSLGLLIDLAGNDSYHGAWYVQGSSAHYAVAALFDYGGNDQYTATLASSQAFGHDASTGMIYDAAGDDSYRFIGGLGWGHADGVGAFADLAGDDLYEGGLLGHTRNAWRGVAVPSMGFFYDGGGADRLPSQDSQAKDKGSWIRRPDPNRPLSLSVGLAR